MTDFNKEQGFLILFSEFNVTVENYTQEAKKKLPNISIMSSLQFIWELKRNQNS